MSLLMEALKKAERAKQAAEGASGETAAPESGELQLAAEDAPAAAAEPPAAEPAQAAPAAPRDLRQGRVDFPRLELESIDDREFDLDPVKPKAAASRETPGSEARGRATARTVFDAKQAGRNRGPMVIGSLAVLAALGIGTYFAVQMLTTGASSLTGPQLASGAVPPREPLPQRIAPAIASPVVQPAAAVIPPPGPIVADTEAAKPVEPAAGAKLPTREARPAATSRSIAQPRATPVLAGLPAAGQRKANAPGDVQVSPASVRVNPVLNRAYDAYLANDFDAARKGYGTVLERDPSNRDALLGLASIAAREQHYADAEALYLRVLNDDPLDSYAQTGLIAIRSPANPVAAETRLKTLIAAKPDAAFLHYALGNLYAGQKRWNDAEQEQFRAFALDSDNADYCYNLAVALDHMRQRREALAHYQRALTLAAARPASFDADRLRARIGELQLQ